MPDLSAGAEIAGYRIEAVVGRGGMGVVYRARDPALDRRVAIKLISAEHAQERGFRERFKRESRLAASIRHPNVITVFRAGEEDGQLFIAMDYIEGTDLKELISSRGRLDPQLAVRVVFQIAAALDAAHAKGLVHRDVKPANVLLEGADHAYLTDFGLTKELASQSGVTATGVVLGTIDYMAPEQVAGAKLDARADIYSLGCVLWEALTGQVPYPRESAVAKMYAHASEPPPPLTATAPDTPLALEAVLTRAMAKKREERYLSAGDLAQAAVAAVEGRKIELDERSVAVGAAALRGEHESASTVRRSPLGPPPTSTAAATARSTWAPGRARRLFLGIGAFALAAIVATVVALSSGGGGGERHLSRSQYQDRVLDAARPWNKAMAAITPRLPGHVRRPRDAQTAGSALAGLRMTTDRFIAALTALRAPSEIEDVHRRLVAIVTRMRSHIADAGAAADFGDDRVYTSVPQQLQTDFAALDALGPVYAAKGYKRLSLGTQTGSS
jgi:tRNA A-37 threonylcarbamoyl transferase component Bud32